MSLIINDRVKETSASTGTGTINLAGAEQGFESFVSGVGNTNTTYYAIANNDEWEIGIGTVTSGAPDTLSRDTVISSSNSDALVNFSAGNKEVFCTIPASRTMSPGMVANDFVINQSSTISKDQTFDSGVLAGPVTITGTQTITGTLVVV